MAEQKLRYIITGDSTALTGALNRASTRVQAFGQSIKNIGTRLQGMSLKLGIAGGVAIKMGVDFDKSMTKIKSLVGLAGDEVDAMAGQVRQMARETGTSSAKAADALFFITSAGLEGDEALSVLNASLKASAVGLGEVAGVADLATSAMNAYASSNLSATDATDILTAAVREGKLNSEELAGAMGQVLPTASAMGVEFHEVGAAMAAMSRTGVNAAHGATQLNAVLSALLKPTTAAEQGLAEMGLSSSGLRQQIEDEGLLSVLDTLKGAIDGNAEAAGKVFPNLRALRAILNLTGDNAESATEIFNKLAKAQGDTQVAFDKTSQSASFRLTKALNTAKESFAEMGAVLLETLLPLFQNIAGAITTLFDKFNNLDVVTQRIITGVGVLVIALPTLLSLFGTLTTIVSALLSPIGLVAAALAGVAFIIHKNWNEVLPVLVGIFNQFVEIFNASKLLRIAIFGIGSVFKSVFIGIKLLVDQFVNTFKTMWNFIKEFSEKGFKGSFGDVLKDGFNNSVELTKKAGQDIATTFTDDFASALDTKLEKTTVDAVQGTLTSVKDKFKNFFTDDILNMFSGFSGGGGEEEKSVLNKVVGDEEDGDKADETKEKVSILNELFKALGNSANVVGEGIKGAFLSAFDAMMQGENIFKALGRMLLDLIKKLVAAAAAAFVLSLLMKSIFPGASANDAKGALKGMGDFKNLMTSFSGLKFAKGGIVSTPTLGLMGEYPGARSNPEVIAPLDRLKSMIGDGGGTNVQVGGEFTLRGQDLVVALQRANRNRDRIN
tara:strand:+ start:2991 stop:5330 length:2340 start_codon:yes stop_codon:yes gene_type:complete